MKIQVLFYILVYSCMPLGATDINASFIAKQNGKTLVRTGNCNMQNPPCSTFKIALALMGFDSGILIDKDTPKWPFKPEYENNFQSWYTTDAGKKYGWHQEHTPETYIAKSVLWFSHQITERLGKERFLDYIHKLSYGNMDISGTPGKDDGLLNSWLETSLKISPQEQVELLEKMLNCELDLSKYAQEKTKEILAKKDEDNLPIQWEGWRLTERPAAQQGVTGGLSDGSKKKMSTLFSLNTLG